LDRIPALYDLRVVYPEAVTNAAQYFGRDSGDVLMNSRKQKMMLVVGNSHSMTYACHRLTNRNECDLALNSTPLN
jgi:hypothetical protein